MQTKNPPLRHPQALAQPPSSGDGDADYDEPYTSVMPSIGLAGGRSMKPRTPLVKSSSLATLVLFKHGYNTYKYKNK